MACTLHPRPVMAMSPAEDGAEGAVEHARLHEDAEMFATEFARLGYSVPRLMQLFADPFYAPAFIARCRLGEPTVRAIVDEAVRRRPPRPRPAR